MERRPLTPFMSKASETIVPVKPSSPRSRSTRTRRLSVAGAASKAGTTTWDVMTASTPASMTARNGTSSLARTTSSGCATTGRSRCESTAVSPWPGKCLAHAATPAARKPADEGHAVARHQRRVGAERADPDDRVGRVAVDVHARRQVERDAGLGHHRPDGASNRRGHRDVVDLSERGVAREAAPRRHLQPGDVAALLVGGHDWLAPGLAQARGQVRHPRAVDDVASKQADAAEPALEPSQEPPRCHRPAERGEEAAVDDGVEVHVSP